MKTELIEKHLFQRTIVAAENVAHRASADQVADFFGHVLSVIAGTLQFLGHRDDVETFVASLSLLGLKMAQQYQVTVPVQLSIGSQHVHKEGEGASPEPR